MKVHLTIISLLICSLISAQPVYSDTTLLQDGRREVRHMRQFDPQHPELIAISYDTIPPELIYARELDTVPVQKYALIDPHVEEDHASISIRRVHLFDIREKHNTADGLPDAMACLNCNYVHIKYLTEEKAPLPFYMHVFAEWTFESDNVPEMKPRVSFQGISTNTLSINEKGENPGDTITFTDRLYPLKIDSGEFYIDNHMIIDSIYFPSQIMVKNIWEKVKDSRYPRKRPHWQRLIAVYDGKGELIKYELEPGIPLPGYLKVWRNETGY